MPRAAKNPDADTGMTGVRAVDRAIAILQCFTPEQPAMSVIEIQKRVGLSRPTLYRLLHTLAARDLVHAEGDPQRFKLAHGVMKLSHVWLNGLEVVAVARPIVEGLRDLTGETAALFRLQHDLGICILECQSRHELSISRGVGHSLKIMQGSTGKAMLAFMELPRQAEFLSGLPADAARTRLEESLKAARRSCWWISSAMHHVRRFTILAAGTPPLSSRINKLRPASNSLTAFSSDVAAALHANNDRGSATVSRKRS